MTGQELRKALAALGLSQRYLASELGVHTVTVSRWCAGALAVPKYASAYLSKCLIAKAFQTLAQADPVIKTDDGAIR